MGESSPGKGTENARIATASLSDEHPISTGSGRRTHISRSEAADLAPVIKELLAVGKTSLRAIAEGLNDAGIPTARGGKWSSPQVMRMLERLEPFREEAEAA